MHFMYMGAWSACTPEGDVWSHHKQLKPAM